MVRFIKYAWLPCAILVFAIMMRSSDLFQRGHDADMFFFNARWARDIQQSGLFHIYVVTPDVNYPPIFLFILAFTSWLVPPFIGNIMPLEFLILTKLFSVVAEIIMIGLIHRWIPKNTRLKWIVPLLLAVHPGLIATTAFWGQTDCILTLFLVLTTLALNRSQRYMTWVWFALVMLMKFQGIVLLPMVGILSLRRFGLRSTVVGILLGLGVFSLVYAPFVIGSGFDSAMNPFTKGAVDLNPVITGNAFNLWYLITPSIWTLLPTDLKLVPSDAALRLGGLTLKNIGFLMLGGYVFLVVIFMWRHYVERREFVWATGLYLAFFMLPTQIHERYLYPAAALSVIAIVQDRRMWAIALPLMLSFTVNIVAVPQEHFYWLGLDLKTMLYGSEVATATFSLFCLIGLVWIIATKSHRAKTDETRALPLSLDTA